MSHHKTKTSWQSKPSSCHDQKFALGIFQQHSHIHCTVSSVRQLPCSWMLVLVACLCLNHPPTTPWQAGLQGMMVSWAADVQLNVETRDRLLYFPLKGGRRPAASDHPDPSKKTSKKVIEDFSPGKRWQRVPAGKRITDRGNIVTKLVEHSCLFCWTAF